VSAAPANRFGGLDLLPNGPTTLGPKCWVVLVGWIYYQMGQQHSPCEMDKHVLSLARFDARLFMHMQHQKSVAL